MTTSDLLSNRCESPDEAEVGFVAATPAQSTAPQAPSAAKALAAPPGKQSSDKGLRVTCRQRRVLLRAHLLHINFLHPLCALLLAALSIAFFAIRLCTEQTVGVHYGMSVLVYLQHVPYKVCVTLGVVNTLTMCGGILGKQHRQLRSLIATARRCLALLVVYGLFSYVIVLLVRADSGQQQLLSRLVVLLC